MVKINNMVVSNNGRKVEVRDGRVYVDGQQVNAEGKEINIEIHGGVESLNVDVCDKIFVESAVQTVSMSSGKLQVAGGVKGSVKTQSGDVSVSGDVAGDISTMSGDVKCVNAFGKIKTMSGDISKNVQATGGSGQSGRSGGSGL